MTPRPLCIVALLLLAQAASAASVPDSSLKAGDSSITVRFSEEVPQAFRTLVENWVHDAADAVMTVYGRYPVKQVMIRVEVGRGGRGVSSGSWLLADIEIRQKSDHRKSLDDVLRAIVAEGGTGSAKWPEEKIFRRGDAAIGMPILEKLHERLGAHPETTDLAALWSQLGVSRKARTVVFNEGAPLAAIRRALTSGKAGH